MSLLTLIIQFYDSNVCNKLQKYLTNKPIVKEFVLAPIKLLVNLAIVSFIAMLMILMFKFHDEYFLPKNLINLDYIQKSLKNNNYKINEIIYFNDKYIFIKHKNEDNSTIEIIKFDNLLK